MNDNRPTAVIFDMDGTLCDVRGIRHLINPANPGGRNFHAFHVESTGCPANQQALDEWDRAGREGHARIIVTARTMDYWQHTLWWLLLNGLEPDDAFMRRHRDFRPDNIVKDELLTQHILPRYNVVRAIDDNPAVIAVWQQHSIDTVTIPGFSD